MVMIVGSGRSGTSSVSGTLKYLGLHVPQPEVEADRTNPQGFFEPQWVVDFHNELMSACAITISDARPRAAELAAEVGRRPENRAQLRSWLGDALHQADELVVKDPRTSWFQELWHDAAREHGVTPSFLTMLRHPAEVSGSRQTYYNRKESPQARRAGNIVRVGGWVNVNLANELANRHDPRAFVRYADLLEDWRATMQEVHARLDLASARDLDWAAPHQVDDFLDPDLRRHQPGWDDVDLPDDLRELADEVWQRLGVLVGSDGRDAVVEAALDELRAEYATMYADAEGLVRHSIQAAAGTAGPRNRTHSAQRRRAAKAASTDPGPADGSPQADARKARAGTGQAAKGGGGAVEAAGPGSRIRRLLPWGRRGRAGS